MSTALATPCTPLAFLEGIGGMEMMLVFVIGLLLFGGKGLPDMARTLGKAIREFKKATANVEDQFKRAMDEEAPPPPRAHPLPAANPSYAPVLDAASAAHSEPLPPQKKFPPHPPERPPGPPASDASASPPFGE